MTHNLKALLAAVLALVAFGSMAASAYASEEFTASELETKTTTIDSERDIFEVPEGTTAAKTSHQVLDIRNAAGSTVLSITCNEAFWTNASIVGPGSKEITSTLDLRAAAGNGNCSFAGQNTVTVSSGNCDFLFTASGQLHIGDDGTLSAGNHCKHGEKPVTFENTEIGCKVEIGAQTISGVKYHNLEEVAGSGIKTITLEITNLPFEYNTSGAGCSFGTTANGTFTTGNSIIRGTRGGSFVGIEWDAA